MLSYLLPITYYLTMAIIENHQHLYGGINPDGSIWFGEGFSAKQLKEGTYVVYFEQSFRTKPAPVCTIVGAEWKTFNLSVAITEILPFHFVCVTSTSKHPVDCHFIFNVFGEV